MAEGRIKWFNQQKGFGFIERQTDDDLFVHINQWRGPGKPQDGQRVTFSEGTDPKGRPEAQNVRPVMVTGKKTKHPPRPEGYRFLNPYNFVRPLSRPGENKEPLLDRCPPPPHDRYVGLSGRITCEMTAVTPLFTADSESVNKDENDHVTLRFFQVDGRPAIPGSSLRGAIRSVFEAATNSCFGVFDGRRRLSYHLEAHKAPQLVPARVEKEDGKWHLRLLTGTTSLQVGRIPHGRQYAAWLHAFWPVEASGTLNKRHNLNSRERDFQRRRARGSEVNLHGLAHGAECYALLEEATHPFPRIKFWDVRAIRPVEEKDRLSRPQSGQRIVKGYLCLNNQNIERKHSERFFFRADDNKTGPQTIPLRDDDGVIQQYKDLIVDYQERHADEVKGRRQKGKPLGKAYKEKGKDKLALSRFIYQDEAKRLQPGDLVYVFLGGDNAQPTVEFMVPVTVPRAAYERRIGELLSGLAPCQELEMLCPACRTFGWVWRTANWKSDDPEVEKPDDTTTAIAYAGRVSIGHAQLTQDAGTVDETLAILSSPKPTTVRFYLMDKNGRNQDGWETEQVDYNAESQILRGRKFYYHHGDQLNQQEYHRAGDVKDDQNRTVKGIQKPGSKFQFEVRFENLATLELGSLLWSLELEGWHHRIGMAKPLGFGSTVIKVSDLKTLDVRARYVNGETGWQTSKKEVFVQQFKQAMETHYGVPFDELDNISDLRALVGESPDLPVHYPRISQQPLLDGKNFEWFMGNSRAGRDAGPRLTLQPAAEEQAGLPLLDKYGRIHDK